MFQSKIWYSFDYISLFLVLCLSTFGVVALAGATMGTNASELWVRQAAWACIGLVACFGVIFIDYRTIIRYALAFYIVGIVGLLLCFVPYIGHYAKGAYSWIRLGPLPQFQPSEFAKLTTIIMLAKVLGGRKEQWTGLLDVMRPLLVGIVPSILILKQPDLGTAIVFGPITLLMMFAAGMPIPFFLLLLSPLLCLIGISHDPIFILLWSGVMGVLLLIALIRRVPWTVWLPFLLIAAVSYFAVFQYGEKVWNQLRDHQKVRITSYFNQGEAIKDANWNIYQSKIALGSGGFWGVGLGKGTQSTYGFLPEYQHDFMFPTVGEQLGFVGGVTLLGLFLLLLMRGLETAIGTKTLYGSLIASGVIALYFSHILINIGMVTGLLPVTGLPLTFISYGGTFMIANMIGIGLLINIRMRTATEMLEDSFLSNREQMVLPKRMESNDIWE